MEQLISNSKEIVKKALMGTATHNDWLDYQDIVYYSVKYGCQTHKNLYKMVINSKAGGQRSLLDVYNIIDGNY